MRRKKSGVPVFSKNEIDAIGEGLVREFNPSALTIPQEIARCSILVALQTVFNDTDKLPVYNPDTNMAEYIGSVHSATR